LKAFTSLSASWKAATAVAEIDAAMIRIPPSRYRFQIPVRSSSNAQVPLPHGPRERSDEADQRLAVVGERGDRHPLVGPVVAAADRAELDRRPTGVQEA